MTPSQKVGRSDDELGRRRSLDERSGLIYYYSRHKKQLDNPPVSCVWCVWGGAERGQLSRGYRDRYSFYVSSCTRATPRPRVPRAEGARSPERRRRDDLPLSSALTSRTSVLRWSRSWRRVRSRRRFSPRIGSVPAIAVSARPAGRPCEGPGVLTASLARARTMRSMSRWEGP